MGIGGVSMYSLAIYCKGCGLKVTGSDIKRNSYTKKCEKNGINVHIRHKTKNVDGCDLVVYSSAIDFLNPEIAEAERRGIKTVSRAEMLACICKNFKCVIGVSGTHGKSTTASMIYHILLESGKRVSCHIGADVPDARLNPYDEFLVLECCEYNKSFLKFDCDIGVVLNIDADHLDCYENMYNLKNAFRTFLKHCKTRFVAKNSTTEGLNVAKSLMIKPAEVINSTTFVIENKKYKLCNVFGEYNIQNAVVAVAVCQHLGVSYARIFNSLKSFQAVGRRCELVGRFKGCDVITDYAHHPTEIHSLCKALEGKYEKIVLIFQPHTYSRTRILLKEFVAELVNRDNLIVFKEYPAREDKSKGVSAKLLSQNIDQSIYVKSSARLKKYLLNMEVDQKSTCIAFVGAGDICEVCTKFVARFGENVKKRCDS